MNQHTDTADRKDRFNQTAREAASFAVHMGHRTICGEAVIAMQSYLSQPSVAATWPNEQERCAMLGTAFDIFATAVRNESN